MIYARHVYQSDIAMYPIKLPLDNKLIEKIQQINNDLMNSYRSNSKRIIYGKAYVDQFIVAPSVKGLKGLKGSE